MKNKTLLDEVQKPLILLVAVFLLYVFLSKGRAAFYAYAVGVFVILLALAFIFLRYYKKRRASFFNTQNTLTKLRNLTPNQFEEYIVDLFQRLGYTTERVGGSYDGGIDVIAEKSGVKHYIQCKKFITRQVTIHDVRDFYGALTDKLSNAKAFFITTNVFTLESEKFCENKPIELIDGKKLMEYVRQAGVTVASTGQAERCPRCGGVLVEKNGRFGPFVGCSNYPTCKFTKPK